MPRPPTRSQVDELLRYLPLFQDCDVKAHVAWRGGTASAPDGGAGSLPYPEYSPEVPEFFALAGKDHWSLADYSPPAMSQLITNDSGIAAADWQQIRGLLTYCVRGERFSDGHWAWLMQDGRITAILRRIEQLRP